MKISQIQNNVELIDKSDGDFIFELLTAYELPKASISRLKSGNLNLSKIKNIVIWKKKLFYQIELIKDLHLTIDALSKDPETRRHNPRFIIVTDLETILAIDTKTGTSLDVELKRLDRHYDFFLPWVGMEKSQLQNENPADIKAAEKMAKLFDEIKKDNLEDNYEFSHELNVFMVRLLFCFFAEDTNIFEEDIFTNGISSYTQEDGSDLDEFLNKLFLLLNTTISDRKNPPSYLKNYPYVGGSLFRDNNNSPKFSRRSRQAIIDSGVLDWSEINPDIFGSMMQSVVSPEIRRESGMHYTSVTNIMKLIEPLFLNDLYDNFEKAKGSEKKLKLLLNRLSNIKILDPACGSGNFLIISYKELRRLEIKVIKELGQLSIHSCIALDNFHGIEIDDFSHEIAILSLWLAKHQMSIEFHEEFGISKPSLPIQETGKIILGNSSEVDWAKLCDLDKKHEIYIIGNPPFAGARNQSKSQKADMKKVFGDKIKHSNLDYISMWFYLGAKLSKNYNASSGFVTTSSITQGEQVSLLWPSIFNMGVEINYAVKSFKWKNSAKNNAHVLVSIIGLKQKSNNIKIIYDDEKLLNVKNISPYLIEGSETIVHPRSSPISKLPKMSFGSMPNDRGYLILNSDEKSKLISKYPEITSLIKKIKGSREFIRGEERWCIWVEEKDLDFAKSIPELSARFQFVKDLRLSSKRLATKKLSNIPHKFAEIRHKNSPSIIVPSVSSENRHYIPMGFLNKDTIISNLALAIYDVKPWLFSILQSKMHMIWIKTFCGFLGSSVRYSVSVCYNTFPLIDLSNTQKTNLELHALGIIEAQQEHTDKSLAQIYDPNKMPKNLKEAHHLNDLAVEKCYRQISFSTDNERLEYLLSLYERMIDLEQSKNTLFEDEVKKKRKRRVNA